MKEDLFMNYGKKKIAKKQKNIASRKPTQKKKLGIRLFKGFLLCFVLLVAVACIGGFLFLKKIVDEAPEITAESVKPTGYITNVYADDGTTLTEQFLAAGANRVSKTLDEIPVNLQHAFVAIEDSRFYEHNGIDYRGIARAFITGIQRGNFNEGASTITQQLLKNSVFNFMEENTFYEKAERKLQEQFLAIELEQKMSKEDILENYLNMINLGQNTLGVQSASLRYFNKDVSELTLSECAVIAGITKNPGKNNPITNPDENDKRREKVLGDMLDQGYITQAEHDEAVADTDVYNRIQAVNNEQQNDSPYTYFIDALSEQVQKDLIAAGYTDTQASNKLYSGGLNITTTQNLALQQICNEEMNNDNNYTSTIKYGISYLLTVTRADGTMDNYSSNDIKAYAKSAYNDNYGLLYSSEERAREVIEEWKATIAQEGDQYDEKLTLSKQPQASVTLIENSTGHIKALVGGRGDKTTSLSLNRAYTGSKRQPGSTFKVLAAYAPAIDKDIVSLSTVIKDEPYQYENGKWVKNWYSGYRGNVTVRKAIEQSMNIIAVKTITDVTPQVAVEYLEDMGITTLESTDLVQSLGLGGITYGVYNYELTAAFAAIANHGLYNEPVLYTKILDHDGNVLLENNGQNSKQVLRESTADLLTLAMEDVVTSGTGTQARLGSMPVAGKTGTTSDDKDVWFVGYTPYYSCAVWLGYDDPKPLSGEWKSHITLWKNIMRRVHDGLEVKDFEISSTLQRVSVCTQTGLLATSSCPARTEYCADSMAPGSYCPGHYVAPTPSEPSEDDPTEDEGTDDGTPVEPPNTDDPNNDNNNETPPTENNPPQETQP